MLCPELAAYILCCAGYDSSVAAVLSFVWTNQRRWLEWDREVAEKPLSGDALPQGDPYGPLVLNTTMWAGFSKVSAILGKVEERLAAEDASKQAAKRGRGRRKTQRGRKKAKHEVYMDDRSWTSPDAANNVAPVRVWSEFSEAAMLKENPSKIQLAGKTAKDMDELRSELRESGEPGEELEKKLKNTIEVLGAETVLAQGR